MILTKKTILYISDISCKDAAYRWNEYKNLYKLNPSAAYDIFTVRPTWPDAHYFDINSIEGLFGKIETDSGPALFLMFRATDSIFDLIRDFILFKKKTPYKGTNKKIKVHAGFLRSYLIVRNFIHSLVENYNLPVIIYGHSLGAAIATLATLDIQYNFPNSDIGALILASPRVGNKAFAESFNGRLPFVNVVDYGSDIVPTVPFTWMGYANHGVQVHIGPARKKKATLDDHSPLLYFDALKADWPED